MHEAARREEGDCGWSRISEILPGVLRGIGGMEDCARALEEQGRPQEAEDLDARRRRILRLVR